jgi:hypothetical protein
MRALLAQVLGLLLLTACPGSNTGVDPCAGVSCAAGRTCVSGTCVEKEGDANLAFSDALADAPLDRAASEARADGRELADGAKKPDAKGLADGAKKPDAKKPPDAKQPDTRPPDLRKPDTREPDLVPPGKWYQASSQVCPTFCATLGRANVGSSEGARCMSGEVRPASGVAAGIAFVYGCWPACTAMAGTIASVSVGGYCYYPGQKQDGDGTDKTVGCFCR